MHFLTDKLTLDSFSLALWGPQNSQTFTDPTQFSQIFKALKSLSHFPKLSKTFKDHGNLVPKTVFKIQDYFITSSEELKRLLVLSQRNFKKRVSVWWPLLILSDCESKQKIHFERKQTLGMQNMKSTYSTNGWSWYALPVLQDIHYISSFTSKTGWLPSYYAPVTIEKLNLVSLLK